MSEIKYNNFARYLKRRFGESTYKISLNAAFTCPNRDNTISEKGCLFCNPLSFTKPPIDLEEQLIQGINKGKQRGIKKFIAYFQSHTNTYADADKLKLVYDIIYKYPEIKGLAIGTRPDCVSKQKLEIIDKYTKDYEVWLEYGLQSMHNKTLAYLQRGHTWQDFLKAVELTRQYPKIKICAHVILGLPDESQTMEEETAKAIAKLKIAGIKFHPLYVVKDTALAKKYVAGKFKPLSQEEYVSRVVSFLSYLWPETIIQRLTADCPAHLLIAPNWLQHKTEVIRLINKTLEEQDIYQGKFYPNSLHSCM